MTDAPRSEPPVGVVRPLVSVIIVHWNCSHLLPCVRSVLEQDFQGTELILVDNASTDDSVAQVMACYDGQVRLVRNPENYGYVRGANAGLRAARGRFLVLLNNDTEAAPGFLAALVAVADSDSQIGMCSPKILNAHDRRVIDNVGHWVYLDGLSRCRGRLEIDEGQYDQVEEVLVPSGCALLLRRETLDDIGLLDEDFLAYCDDTDLGLRAQLRGWRCLTAPDAVVYHWGSSSSPFKAFLVERNRLWVAVKCLPLPFLLLAPLFTTLRFAFLAAGVLLGRGPAGRFVRGESTPWVPGRPGRHVNHNDAWLSQTGSPAALLTILLRAILAGLRGLPAMWRKRRRIQRRRSVSLREVAGWWRRHGLGPRQAAWSD